MAIQGLTLNEAINLLYTPKYFEILKIPVPDTEEKIFHYMKEGNIILKQDNGGFSITGTGSVIEVFKPRLEVTNLGIPLIDIDRILLNLVMKN